MDQWALPRALESLLAWYDTHRRDLPWRRDKDPYRVWVSEVMLQQTRVETVVPYYARWLERFPDIAALADASEGDVMAAWAGLGYYGRARRLHAAARLATKAMPTDAAGWRALPGVGAYTAGAVASIAFGEVVPAIDGNAIRVLARWLGLRDVAEAGPGRRAIDDAARRHIDADRPGDWNQALMDLGSLVCTPVAPRCGACPMVGCVARRDGSQDEIPVLRAKKAPVEEVVQFARITGRGALLVVPRPRDGLLAGTWMLPGGAVDEALEDQVLAQTGLVVRLGGQQARIRHVFTHRVWTMHVHDAEIIEGAVREDAHWVDVDAPDVALSTAARKAMLA